MVNSPPPAEEARLRALLGTLRGFEDALLGPPVIAMGSRFIQAPPSRFDMENH
jgi:hypothetical protein